MSSCHVDPRMDATNKPSYHHSSLAAAAPDRCETERMQDVNNPLDDEENDCGCTGEASTAYVCVSNRFLHSDENLEECDTDDDEHETESAGAAAADDDENLSKEALRRRQAAFLREPASSQHPRSPHQWANRQLHRSVSVDDLMEYQREFRLEDVGRSNSAHDLTDYQREFQSILAEQSHETMSRWSSSDEKQRQRRRPHPPKKESLVPSPPPRGKRSIRNSIANSDLAEFKRQFFQAGGGASGKNIRRSFSADNAKTDTHNQSATSAPPALQDPNDPATVARKLENLKNAMDYQWGTRSLRKAMLGSDLGTFERSLRTALLESSRENSSAGSIESSSSDNDADDEHDDDNDDDDEYDDDGPPESQLSSTKSTLSISHRDSVDMRPPNVPVHNYAVHKDTEEDWGTRSLRKSLKELDLSDPTPYRPKPRIDRMDEDQITLPLDTPLQHSPWKEDKVHPSSNGLKMPRRVTSGDNDHPGGDHHGDEHNNNTNKHQPSPPRSPLPHRSSSMVDTTTISADEPEFEWQLRSCFRRSISSSDIEKYQRHFEDDDGVATTKDERKGSLGDSIDDRSTHTLPAMGSASLSTQSNGMNPLHPLLANLPHTSTDLLADENEDEDSLNNNNRKSPPPPPANMPPNRPPQSRRTRRRHRRSNSDEPELHMENVIADVAPRKPTRTTSRPISPPPPRPVVVRFADNATQVVEIPKVSDDLKPYLFYTKRDVKRFRMNEHRRQEEQIRSYMEYLNQKENVLDSSPCIFD